VAEKNIDLFIVF